jgi:hypothetical protein
MNNFIIKVNRFTSLYPQDEPNSYIVGFSLKCKLNERVTYKETRIYYKDVKALGLNIPEEKIVEIAWDKIHPQLKNWCRDVEKKSQMTGKMFVPKM